MPQLIAMVIVVVGAMIYMFQTFGGTGDKIEGIAQKTSIVTEINNIRNGLQLAVRAGDINTTPTTLFDLAGLGYFADQMNNEISDNVGDTISIASVDADGNFVAAADTSGTLNTYSAISFGGENNPGMLINLVVGDEGQRPGIRVQLIGALLGNADFLESQLATDLASVASLDRTTLNGAPALIDANGDTPAETRPDDNAATPGTANAADETLRDGIFTIYFKDMPQNIVLP